MIPKRMASDDLEKIARDNLSYVIWMLNQTAILFDKPKSPKNNAYIESFVIHARILIEFLYGKPNKKDTILAANYVDDWWANYISKGKPLEKSEFLKNIEIKADKMAAHLTEAGSNYSDKDREWDRTKIRDEINKIILGFLNAVPDTLISERTKSEIRKHISPLDLSNEPYDIALGTGATGPNGP
jgi:hypothetical protein